MLKFWKWVERFAHARATKLALKKFYKENPHYLKSHYVEKRYVYRMASLHGRRGFWLDLRKHGRV